MALVDIAFLSLGSVPLKKEKSNADEFVNFELDVNNRQEEDDDYFFDWKMKMVFVFDPVVCCYYYFDFEEFDYYHYYCCSVTIVLHSHLFEETTARASLDYSDSDLWTVFLPPTIVAVAQLARDMFDFAEALKFL